MQDRSFEKNGFLVSANLESVPSRITVVSPQISVTDRRFGEEALILELSFSLVRRGIAGLSVYIATEPVDEVIRQQRKFNARAAEGNCPTYRLGAFWHFRLDGSVSLWEETSGFDDKRLLGKVPLGKEVSYHGGSRYLVDNYVLDERAPTILLGFSAITDQGVNSVKILRKPAGVEELIDSFDFSVGIR